MRWPDLVRGAAASAHPGLTRGSALALAMLLLVPAAGRAQQALVPGPVMISDARVAAAAQGGTSTAVMTLANNGALEEHLLGGACPAAATVTLQPPPGTAPDQARGSLSLPPGATVSLSPGGWHLALSDLHVALTAGSVVACTVRLDLSGEMLVEMTVSPPGQGG